MDLTTLLIALVIGAMAGWLAGQLAKGTGFGLLGDMLVGIVGAVIAVLLLPMLSLDLERGVLAAIVETTLGAFLSLVIVRLINQAMA